MSKHWDYEDDHDGDDDFDYQVAGYKYWYGKYYPADRVDALFEDSSEKEESVIGEVEVAALGFLL